MTNAEAIEKFKKIKRGNIFLIHQRIEEKEVIEDYSLCDMAISALEKQIPKEPNYKVEDRYIKNHFISIPICPICHREIVAGDMHCYSCGQRISWEE